ncbi:spindle pole body component 110-like, partial [Passer montanus]|uniref:spindle pole body component 110-like n=1 Tax=Passer montanus TaxID=9160 RepID=UPI00195FD5D5
MSEQVCQQLERITSLNKEKEELQQMVETCKEREEHLLKVQRQSEISADSLTSKIQQLTKTLNSVSCEKDQLLAESNRHSLQLQEQISSVNHEKDELVFEEVLQSKQRDQLKTELQRNSEMCVETKAKLEDALEQLKQRNLNNMSIQVNTVGIAERVADNSLTEKTLKIKAMKVKIQKLENVINEVGDSVKERDEKISKLQAQMRIRTETSELTQLQAKLNEMDN